MAEDTIENYLNHKGKGFVQVWAVNPTTGEKQLLIDKPNMILNEGADILAQAIAGAENAKISHIYIGYKNTTDLDFTKPHIDPEYSVKFTYYTGSGDYADFGYLRLPLSYSPSFIAQPGFNNNIVIFTTTIASNNLDNSKGQPFQDSGQEPPSRIFEVALVAALDPTSSLQDKVFSRANFSPLLYDSNFNLTITWGVQFLT